MKRNAETSGKHLSKKQHEAANAAAGKTAKGAEPNKKKRKTKVIVGFIMLLIIIALIAFLVADHYLDKINRENLDDIIGADDETFDGDGEGGIDPNDVSWGKVKKLDDPNLVNILLVGQTGQTAFRYNDCLQCQHKDQGNITGFLPARPLCSASRRLFGQPPQCAVRIRRLRAFEEDD